MVLPFCLWMFSCFLMHIMNFNIGMRNIVLVDLVLTLDVLQAESPSRECLKHRLSLRNKLLNHMI